MTNRETQMEMTHEDRRQRRAHMAAQVKRGTPRREVAKAYGVSDRLVRMSCEEHDVEYDRASGGSPAGIVAIVAGLMKSRRKRMSTVASETGNSKQRVYQVLQECIRYGLVKRTKFGRNS